MENLLFLGVPILKHIRVVNLQIVWVYCHDFLPFLQRGTTSMTTFLLQLMMTLSLKKGIYMYMYSERKEFALTWANSFLSKSGVGGGGRK